MIQQLFDEHGFHSKKSRTIVEENLWIENSEKIWGKIEKKIYKRWKINKKNEYAKKFKIEKFRVSFISSNLPLNSFRAKDDHLRDHVTTKIQHFAK